MRSSGDLARFAAISLTVGALMAFSVTAWREARRSDPRYATPMATLLTYIECVKLLDEDGELSTATPELRARAEAQRGQDMALRKERLKGKATQYKQANFEFGRPSVTGNRAQIRVVQGRLGDFPDWWVYSFHRIGGDWKISRMERSGTGEKYW